MRFFEYEAREIVKRAGIPVTDFGFATTRGEAREIAQRIGGPVVIKSQVLTGGRMKAGGVQFAETPDEAESKAAEVLALAIDGHVPRGVLVDQRAAVAQEYYAGVVWDGIRKRPVMLFSDMGGIDIEDVAAAHPDHVGRGHFSNLLPLGAFEAKQVIASVGISGSRLNRLVPILTALARLFVVRDMTLAEINPLGELEDGSFVALDAHMDMENEARPRQAGLLDDLGVGDDETRQAREATRFELAGEAVDAMDHRGVAGNVTEFDGDLGLVIGAGGGSLTLFDAVRGHGGRPANYCEIGGNPSVRKACALAKLVLQKPGVDKIAVMMSIVSNTRVDIVARGVVKACLELGHDPAEKIAIFRIPGAWEEEGFKILERYGVPYADRSVSLDEAARRAVEGARGATVVEQPEAARRHRDAGPDAPRKVARSATGEGRPEADRSSQDAGPDAPRR
jgi:succinyl-CoA synthetase beta subunit